MMRKKLHVPALLIFVLGVIIYAQPSFEIISLEGTAKVQGPQKQKWDKLSTGEKLSDNDIVETFFQTKLTLRLTDGTLVFFGSNSKALINLAAKETGTQKSVEAAFSLFNGGILVKANGKTHVNIFTTNAVGEIDSGALSAILDAKSGETGMLVLAGKATVRNIAQQKGKELTVGFTTLVLPDREPAPPLYITFRHVAVLKHFFGDRYIGEELRSSSITPAEDRNTNSRIMLSQGLSLTPDKQAASPTSYKRQFSLNSIYGSILDDQDKQCLSYMPVEPPEAIAGHDLSITLASTIGLAQSGNAMEFSLLPRYRLPWLDAALRISVAQNYLSTTVLPFSSLRGIFNNIDHLTVGFPGDSLLISAGTINDLTIGHGLVVSHFRNADANRLFHPLGINGTASLFEMLKVKAFLADAASPSLGGVHVALEPSNYYFGAGLYYDANQYNRPNDTDDLRFANAFGNNPVFPDTAKTIADASIYELDFSMILADRAEIYTRIDIEFAQKISNGSNDGILLRFPSITFGWPNWSLNGGFLIETGRLISREFDEFYCSHRSVLLRDMTNATPAKDTLLTPTTALNPRRFASSLFASVGTNAIKGTDISLSYTQGVSSENAFAFRSDSIPDTAQVKSPLDFSLGLRFAVKEETIPFIRFGELYFRQNHGTLFPRSGSIFSSWNCEAGFDCISEPLYKDVSLEVGGKFFNLYNGGKRTTSSGIEAQDRIIELFINATWGFL
jgi:hypothetical protein